MTGDGARAAWEDLGLPEDDIRWYGEVRPSIADAWIRAGYQPDEMVTAHRARVTLRRVEQWHSAGLDLQTTVEWARFGFMPEEVEPWRTHGFRAAAAYVWKKNGFDPSEAYRRAVVLDLPPVPAVGLGTYVVGEYPRPDDPPDVLDVPEECRDREDEWAEFAPHLPPTE